MMQREYAEGIPSGLISCRMGNRDVHIIGISPRGVLLRSCNPLPQDIPLTFYFYQPETGNYLPHTLNHYEPGEARREDGAVLTRVFFDDAACAAHIRNALNSYARYVQTRSEAGASAYGQETTGYPLKMDDAFPASLEKARSAWFAQLPPLVPDKNVSLAISLNCRELCQLYLSTPIDAFVDAYAVLRHIPRSILPQRQPDRLYIGNEYCRLASPCEAELHRLIRKAQDEKLSVTLVTAELRAGEETLADQLLSLAAEHGFEVEINDWGMLNRAQSLPNKPVLLLGTQLNRRRKDPRIQWKSGIADRAYLLGENALNSSLYRKFLSELGVVRCEYESCGLPLCPPDMHCSLHLPFYQTNTALWCPLRALCTGGDRGRQTPANNCPGWCENNALLYPEHLYMLGRWNSLLALDVQPHISPGFDRWVLNF